MDFQKKERYSLEDLVEIVSLLRGENGCPWDKVQTHDSIRYNFIEEVYEAVEAIELKDPDLLKEELGDVLLQVVFHAQIEQEQNKFDLGDVANDICVKLIERHPHIFADVKASEVDEVLDNWDAIKREQKNQEKGSQTLEAVPKVFPALMRAQKVQKRANKLGFGYSDIQGAFGDLEDEFHELREAMALGDPGRIASELGDLLFSCANLARYVEKESEECLSASTDTFIRRVKSVEDQAEEKGLDLVGLDAGLRGEFWNIAKK